MRERCYHPEQDYHVLSKIFKAGQQLFPYLTKKRFPHGWAQAEILKQVLKNSRRSGAKRERDRNNDYTLKKRKNFTYGESSDVTGSPPTPGPSRPSKRARIHNPIDDSEDEDMIGHQHRSLADEDDDDLYN